MLKDRYDRRQLESLAAYKELPLLENEFGDSRGEASNADGAATISNPINMLAHRKKPKFKKRDLKALDKDIWISSMDEAVFDKTVEEVKFRYYEVARALLKHRGEFQHPLLKNYQEFDIEYETIRKSNWERVFSRGKELYQKEKYLIDDHLKLEAQIRRIERQDAKKQALVGKMAGIKVPRVTECTLIDPKEEHIPTTRDECVEEEQYGLKCPSIYDKVGIPAISEEAETKDKSAQYRTSGVYFMSNELTQDLPLPENLQ